MSDGLYVYAVVHHDGAQTSMGEVLASRGLNLVPWRGLAAITRRTSLDAGAVSMDAVRQHEAVVEALLEDSAALPVRFGTIFRDAASVTSALAEQYEPLAADLARVGGKAELSLTALWVSPPVWDGPGFESPDAFSTERAGARYLRARAALLQREQGARERARAIAEALDRELASLTLERRVRLLPTPRIAVRTAYLLERSAVTTFRTAFEGLRRTQSELRLLLTGPWPPYSFVTSAAVPNETRPANRLDELARMLDDAMRERRG